MKQDVSPDMAGEAQQTAADIRAETSKREPNMGSIKTLLFTAMTKLAGSFGQSAGTDIAGLAHHALQSIQ
jgi:hypothetical protein